MLVNGPLRLAAAVSVPLGGGALAIEAGDVLRADVMDTAFHNALVTAADNPLLSRAIAALPTV
jgi:DNA-binding GntR family transcriptional regulator